MASGRLSCFALFLIALYVDPSDARFQETGITEVVTRDQLEAFPHGVFNGKSYINWDTMVRIFLHDSFPATERGLDATWAKDENTVDYRNGFDYLPPLGYFRVTQGVAGLVSYATNDRLINVPDYLTSMHWTRVANDQYRDAFANHKRAFFKVITPRPVCETSKAVFDVPGPRIISIMHEPNMPFEVECNTCILSDDAHKVVTSFHILPKRDVFAEVDFNDRLEVLNAGAHSTRFRGKSERFHYRAPFAAFLRSLAVNERRELMVVDPTQSMLPVFAADRWWNTHSATPRDEFSGAFGAPDGRLRVNPYPEYTTGKISSYFSDLNSMTLVCAREMDGKLYPTDVIVNVDTLVDLINYSNYEDFFKAMPPRKIEAIKVDEVRMHIGDYKPVPIDFDEVKRRDLNIKLAIGFEEWSCCSACCCSARACAQNHALSDEDCNALESYRTRRGYLSFFKIDPLEGVHIELVELNEDTVLAETVLSAFSRYLSTDPYFTTGIPVHSSLFTVDHVWLRLRSILLAAFELDLPYNRIVKFKGRFGAFIETEDCAEMEEKVDCTVLERCRKRLYDPLAAVSKFVSEQRDEESSELLEEDCERDPAFTVFYMNFLEAVIDVKEKESYIVIVNETLFGKIAKITWHAGLIKLQPYNKRWPCLSQHLAITAKRNGFMISEVHKDDTKSPYIGKATMMSDLSVVTLKVIFRFTEAKSDPVTGIIVPSLMIVIFVALAAVLVCTYFRVLSITRKRQREIQEVPQEDAQ